ncbi:MAG: hypothetical protein J6252_05365 [Clostridia bacterium]|nr:hypothetical protein [Clostridia bacterium]
MQNRKFRINILDIAIIAAVICVAAIIIFRAEISELIGSPEIATVQLQLEADEVPAETAKTLKSGDAVLLAVEGEQDDIPALITEVRYSSPAGNETVRMELTLEAKGYSRFGTFYTERGTKLVYGEKHKVSWENGAIEFALSNCGYKDETVRQ